MQRRLETLLLTCCRVTTQSGLPFRVQAERLPAIGNSRLDAGTKVIWSREDCRDFSAGAPQEKSITFFW
jgi:hypothetical protein